MLFRSKRNSRSRTPLFSKVTSHSPPRRKIITDTDTTAPPEGFRAADGLVWLQERPSHCPICHHRLQGQDYSLELELPIQGISGSITLFDCLHCPAPASGVLQDLARFLTSADQPDVAHRVELFEIAAFCVDGRWLEVDVEMQADHQTVPWGVYAKWLEAQTELAESEAVRRRFMPQDLGMSPSTSDVPDQSMALEQLDVEDP